METTPQPQQANTSPAPAKAQGNIFAAISYLPPFLFLVTTFMKGKTDEFAFWHAKRGAALAVIGIIAWAIGYTIARVLGIGIVSTVLNICLAVAAIFLAWKAWNNQKNAVPLLDKIAAKIPLEKLIGQSAPASSTAAPAASPAPTAPASVATPVSTPVTNTAVEKKEEPMPAVQAEPVGGMSKPEDAPVVAATTPAPAAVAANPAPVASVEPAATPAPAPQAAAPAPAAMPETPAAPAASQAAPAPSTPTQNPPAQQ